MPHCPCCIVYAALSMLPCPCCIVLAALSMPHFPCCIVHAALSMLHCPCCIVLTAFSMLHCPCCIVHAALSMPHCPCCVLTVLSILHFPCCIVHTGLSMLHCPCCIVHAAFSMPHCPCCIVCGIFCGHYNDIICPRLCACRQHRGNPRRTMDVICDMWHGGAMGGAVQVIKGGVHTSALYTCLEQLYEIVFLYPILPGTPSVSSRCTTSWCNPSVTLRSMPRNTPSAEICARCAHSNNQPTFSLLKPLYPFIKDNIRAIMQGGSSPRACAPACMHACLACPPSRHAH